MTSAQELVATIRQDLRELDEKIRNHPFLQTLESGEVRREGLRMFAGQQFHIISSDLRSLALLVSRHGTLPSRHFLMNSLAGEVAAREALESFARALGMTTGELEACEPLPAAHAYCAYVAWLALYGSDAELAGAFLVNFAAWGANCGRMSKSLQAQYGMDKPAVAFFDLFANLPPFEEEALSVIQGGLDRGIPARLIPRAARMLQGYELMYWDAMVEAAGIVTSARG
jgi:thiaminase